MKFAKNKSRNNEYCLLNFHQKDDSNRAEWTNWFSNNQYDKKSDIYILNQKIILILQNIPQSKNIQSNQKGKLFWNLPASSIELVREIEKEISW